MLTDSHRAVVPKRRAAMGSSYLVLHVRLLQHDFFPDGIRLLLYPERVNWSEWVAMAHTGHRFEVFHRVWYVWLIECYDSD